MSVRRALLNLTNLNLHLGRVARAWVSIDALAGQRTALAPQQHAR